MADEQQPAANGQQPAANSQQEPGPVPYERFKEVNEQLKTFKTELEKFQKAAQTAKEKELTEQQKWEQLFKERDAELKSERTANLKMKVALDKGLPSQLIDRLRGDDEESLAKDADALLALMKPSADPAPKTPGVPPSRGGKPARLDISTMSPAEIRKHRDDLFKQSQS